MIYSPDDVARMKHFATAFFGYYLQEKEEYKYYFSNEFVNLYEEFELSKYSEVQFKLNGN